MPPNTKKCEEQFKTYKERADYLSDINPQNTQIYRAIAHFFGEDLIPCGTKELNEKIMNDGSHTPQNEKSDQPKPEVPKCEGEDTHEKGACPALADALTSPASTEDWEEKVKNVFEDLRKELTNIDYSEKYIFDIVRFHDQQLRQRIVEDKLEIYGKYHCKKCNTEMRPKARLSWILKVGVRCVHVCPREDCGEIFIEKEH